MKNRNGIIGITGQIIFLFFLILVPGALQAKADSYVTLPITVQYNQSEARKQLSLINAYRQENGVGALTYDYTLEAYAMQRAAENAVQYSHTRPDGTEWSSSFPESYTSSRSWSRGENIWESSTSAEAADAIEVFAGSPAHNAAMLNTKYTAVGFAFCTEGKHGHWVQIFHSHRSSKGAVAADNSVRQVSVRMNSNKIYLNLEKSNISVTAGEWVDLPPVYVMAGDAHYKTASVSWSSEDPSLVEVSGNKVRGKGTGTVNVNGTASDMTVTCSVFTHLKSIYRAEITLSPAVYTYTGNACTPSVTVVVNGKTLVKGTDYTVSYYSNIDAGTAFGTVTGTGYYDDTKKFRFQIEKAGQSLSPAISSKTLTVGSTAVVKANGYGKLTYSSSNSAVATVTRYIGTVRAVSPGTAVITVNAEGDGNHKEASGTVTVEVKAAQAVQSSSAGTSAQAVQSSSAGTPKTSSGSSAAEKVPDLSVMQDRITTIKGYADPSGSAFGKLCARAKKTTKNSITLAWKKVKGATGYVIYGSVCNNKKEYRKVAAIQSGSVTSKKITKVNGAKLKKGKHYKFIVVAIAKTASGTEKALATSKSVHAITKGSKKYGNYTKITLKNVSGSKLTLGKGRTFQVRAKAVKPSGKKVKIHRKISWESSKKSVASVSKSGKITAKKKGTCYIYAYAQSGVYKRIKVTVTG